MACAHGFANKADCHFCEKDEKQRAESKSKGAASMNYGCLALFVFCALACAGCGACIGTLIGTAKLVAGLF